MKEKLKQKALENITIERLTKEPLKSKIKRSRTGCHNCKKLKIKCNEAKPSCSYCLRTGVKCDYSLKLTWGGRTYKNSRKQKKDYSTPIAFQQENTSSLVKPKEVKVPENDSLKFLVEEITNRNSMNQVETIDLTNPGYTDIPMASVLPVKRLSGECNFSNNDNFKINRLSYDPPVVSPSSINSPSSFSTPNGQSILSPYNSYDHNSTKNIETLNSSNIIEDINRNNDEKDMGYLKNIKNPPKTSGILTKSPVLHKNFPELCDGVESLSMVLDNITNGHPQILKSSRLLNDYVDEIINPTSLNHHGLQEYFKLDPEIDKTAKDLKSQMRYSLSSNLESLSNYSEDLKATEQYCSLNNQLNLIDDIFSPSYTSIITQRYKKNTIDYNSFDDYFVYNSSSTQIQYDEEGKRIITPEEVFASIPPQFTPLPEILLQVPFYRSLMDFWVNVTADSLVPAPSQIYKDNPFKVLLPQMAMEYPSILTTLLAFSAEAKSLLTGIKISKEIVDQLIARSCKELVRQLQSKDTAISDGTLATVLLLSCNEVFNSKDFAKHRVHTIGARQIIKARHNNFSSPESSESSSPNSLSDRQLHTKAQKPSLESDIAYFLTRWFVYIDVIGAFSATKNSHDYLNPDELEINEVNMINGLEQNMTDTIKDPKRDIDHLLGFDVRFLPFFKEVILLIRKTEAFTKQNISKIETLPITYISKALEIKENITKQYKDGEARRKKMMTDVKDSNTEEYTSKKLANLIEQNNILRCTNKMFCDMAIINLYRRVLKIPRESAIIQEIANGILQILEDHIEPESLAEICTIFCIFSAACETLSPKMQQLALNRFNLLSKMGNVNATKSLKILDRCWTTGCDWIKAARELNIDMALL